MGSLLGRRVGAYLVDIVLLFAVLAPLGQLVLRLTGQQPTTGQEIWVTILWNFSVPVWLYFIVSARSAGGATLGKRLLGIRIVSDGGRLSLGQAIIRTAVLFLLWELIHLAGFAFSQQMSELSRTQSIILIGANLIVLAYLLAAIITRGHQSIDDIAARTTVVPAASRPASEEPTL